MANGYDDLSLRTTGMKEAQSSSDSAGQVAVRDKRYTRSGIGFRTQKATEASTLDPGVLGQTPPPIVYPDGYPGGLAARKRGQVDEAKLPWESAQEATTRQIRPRESLPPWLKDKGDEEKESLPPWLKKKEGDGEDEDEEKEAAPADPDMEEAPLSSKGRDKLSPDDYALGNRRYPIDTPERARSALARVEQFGSDAEAAKVKAAVHKKYPDMKVG